METNELTAVPDTTRKQTEREQAKMRREINGALWTVLLVGVSLGATAIGLFWFFSTCTCAAF